ncbi:MAG TPA: permease, partial [bacterium]|nr:permease [bacterium]
MLSTCATLGALVTGTLLEAFPYIVLGALVSALLEVFIPATLLQRLAGRGTLLNIGAALFAGFVFPVCECGIIPVVARLRTKGMATGPLLAYLYAAPAVQPIVLYSTYVAFNDSL